MFKLKEDCEKCSHNVVCKNKNNAKNAMEKLKNTRYGDGPNDDYGWDIMSNNLNITITFSCPDYMDKESIAIHRRKGVVTYHD